MLVNLPLLDIPAADYGPDEAAMARYREEGTARALAMDNRGPIRFGPDGRLDPAILDAYARHGFYVFEKVLGRKRAGRYRARSRGPVGARAGRQGCRRWTSTAGRPS